MGKYKVVYEIEVDASSALNAAKEIFSWMKEEDFSKQFYVQNERSQKIYSVDLDESDKDAVLPVHCYHAMIENKK